MEEDEAQEERVAWEIYHDGLGWKVRKLVEVIGRVNKELEEMKME